MAEGTKTKVLDRDWNADFTQGTITHIPTGEVLTFNLSELDAVPQSEIARRLIIHGWHQKVGDSVAKSGEPEADFDKMASIHERLLAGEWTKARDVVGPRPTMLMDAFFNVLNAARVTGGKATLTDAERAVTTAKYVGDAGKDFRAKIAADPHVAREYETIRRAAADARLADRAAKTPAIDLESLA